ncbi:OFA family MFS transporter [Paenibacillus sp. Marseille-Q4541]|uniref:L-lactate MFS transporter n=1 Tax=Paenibacillus sp. Marseille-Q4541 TaxID=2831522 RepID=UPI001BA4F719|nr:OFA family MFS transporter [Paenibacillus sp. Marseille-Q4541]
MNGKPANRLLIVLGTVIMQMGLGTIYTWSLFNSPLVEKFGWDLSSVSITFSITSFALAFSTLFAGKIQEKIGLRKLTAAAGVLLGIGLILSSQASSLASFYILAGVIVGFADGTAYITSLSNLMKWFPDRKGLISGISVGAYGTGSLVFKYINGSLINSVGISQAFLYWGLIVMAMILVGSTLVREAPIESEKVSANNKERTLASKAAVPVQKNYTVSEMLRTKQAYLLFVVFFTACMSGLYLIGIVKDIGMQLADLNAATAANAVALVAIFNTAGRLILGALSDKVSRLKLVSCTLAVTATSALILSVVPLNYGLFFVCVAAIAFCFGGNITVFPAIVSDFFGLKNQTKNYGVIYQGFGIGALSGSFIAAMMGGFKPTFIVIAGLCILSVLIALTLRPPMSQKVEKDVPFKAYKRTA